MSTTTFMEKEILSQAEKLVDCREYNREILSKIASEFKRRGLKHIVAAARGSSDNACNYFKYLCETYAGIPVSFAAPSVVTLYNGKLDMSGDMVVGVSQSGKAADVLAVMERAKKQGAITVAVTNNLESPMAKAADYHIYLNVGEEKSVAATKTMTSQMYVLALLVAELGKDKALVDELNNVPKLIEEVYTKKDGIFKGAESLVKAIDCYVLARGMNYAAAQEAALKIQETTYVKARSYAVSDFHHGPFAVIDETSNAVILAPSGESANCAREMIEKIKATGANLIVFSDDESYKGAVNTFIPVPKASDIISPIAYVISAQFFSLRLSILRGLNPDNPRGLNKVTITK